MKKKNFAFEQVDAKYPDVKREVDEMRQESDTWIITWPDDARETTMVGLAWYAREFDDEAVVTPA